MPNEIHGIRNGTTGSFVMSCWLAAFLWFVLSGTSLAHRVTIFAWVEGDTVHTESMTVGGKGIKNATVSVRDREGNRLLAGRTDPNGLFSFKVPQKTDLTVVLEAAMGHRAEWTIPARELAAVPEKPDTAAVDQTQDGGLDGREARHDHKGDPASDKKQAAGLDRQEMEALINEALDQKLRPIITHLSESAHGRPKITEIIGGVGYIFGIAGLALYILNRKKGNQQS